MSRIVAVLFLAGASLSATPAFSVETRPPIGGGVSTAVQTAAGVTDPEQFVNMATVSSIFEIESSQLALQKAQDQSLRSFAQQMISDHQAALDRMAAVFPQANVQTDLPKEVDLVHADKLNTLRGASNFDEQYLRTQIEAHDEAIALFKSFASDGKNTVLQQYAAEMLPIVQRHRDMLPAQYPAK